MKLFGSTTSPYVRHCRVALQQQGVEYEFVDTDYTASARQSPTQRVPFLQAGDLQLTDSTSILRWIREQGGRRFLDDSAAFDRYWMATTALDSTVNLFLLERDGLTPEQVPYLARQRDRVATSLQALEQQFANVDPGDDDGLRLACFLSWAAFRQRVDASAYPVLTAVVSEWDSMPGFAATHPSRSA